MFQIGMLPAIPSPVPILGTEGYNNGPEGKGLLQEHQSRPASMSFRIPHPGACLFSHQPRPNLRFSF